MESPKEEKPKKRPLHLTVLSMFKLTWLLIGIPFFLVITILIVMAGEEGRKMLGEWLWLALVVSNSILIFVGLLDIVVLALQACQ
jgi:hypothetical protein